MSEQKPVPAAVTGLPRGKGIYCCLPAHQPKRLLSLGGKFFLPQLVGIKASKKIYLHPKSNGMTREFHDCCWNTREVNRILPPEEKAVDIYDYKIEWYQLAQRVPPQIQQWDPKPRAGAAGALTAPLQSSKKEFFFPLWQLPKNPEVQTWGSTC